MNGYVITVANMKGGVGKTTTVVALAHALAADEPGTKVLVIDADCQASASFSLAGDELHCQLIEERKTITDYLDNLFRQKSGSEPTLHEHIRDNVVAVMHHREQLNVSLIASSPPLRSTERGLIHALTRKKFDMEKIEVAICELFQKELAVLRAQYDYIIFDSAPGISLLTEASIRLADLVVVPTIPDYLSVLGLNGFTHNVWNQITEGQGRLPRSALPPHVLISRRQQNSMHKKYIISLIQRAVDHPDEICIFNTVINELAAVPKAVEKTATGFFNFQQLWGMLPLQDLVNEIKGVLTPLRQAAE